MPQSLGIIGGRPRRSHYFIGCHGDELLYLDPHEVQPALTAQSPEVATCHFTRNIRTTPLLGIDPSLALGFLCTSSSEFDDLWRRCEETFATGLAPFSMSRSPPTWRASEDELDEDGEGGGEEDMVVL